MNLSAKDAQTLQRALNSHRQGRLADAERLYADVLAKNPRQVDALQYFGFLRLQQGRAQDAVPLLSRALEINARLPDALSAISAALSMLGRHREALDFLDRLVGLQPTNADAHYNRGFVLSNLGRNDDALTSYERAVTLNPRHVDALFNRANTFALLARPDEALAGYDRVLAAAPSHLDAAVNRANLLAERGRHEEALADFRKVLGVKPDHIHALNNSGNVLRQLGRHEEALASYAKVLAIDPGHVDALYNRGNTLARSGRHDEALPLLDKALSIDPTHPQALNALAYCRLALCDWDGAAALFEPLTRRVRDGAAIEPFTFLALGATAEEQLACAQVYTAQKTRGVSASFAHPPRARPNRLRIAYCSADFRAHPLGYLVADLFERHDRARFDIVGVSLGADDGSEIRSRLVRSFDRFLDVRDLSDAEAAEQLRAMDVDIVIDLNGHTDDARPGILARRPAPVQAGYLGFAGTSGAAFIDYVIADGYVLPFDQQPFYSEKIVHLPHSYLVNDTRKKVAARIPTRAEANLPEGGFVFCGFASHYKITRTMFDRWMRLLARVDGSVLWLTHAPGATVQNLRREAERQGVDPKRVIFAPLLRQMDDHLARHALADVFLDTQPYGGHSTAADALWLGVPVVTCAGSVFASRVAGSLLHAVGLPELATQDLAGYENLAVALATDPDVMRATRARLATNKLTHPLFDTAQFCRHIEAAYDTMFELWSRGEGPQSFSVDASG